MISSLKRYRKIVLIMSLAAITDCKFPHHTPIDVHATLYITINNNLDDTVAIQYNIRTSDPKFTIEFNSEDFTVANQSSFDDTITYEYEDRDPCGFIYIRAKTLAIDAKVFIKDTLYNELSIFPWDTTFGYHERYPDYNNCNKVTWDTLNIN